MSRLRRILRVLSLLLLAAILLVAAAAGTGWWYFHPELSVTRGVVYTQRDGREVTLDVYRPAKANGIGVILMVSGGWQSHPPQPRSLFAGWPTHFGMCSPINNNNWLRCNRSWTLLKPITFSYKCATNNTCNSKSICPRAYSTVPFHPLLFSYL